MLILTRKSGEAIRIGDEVTLKIIEIRGNQVRLGVEAPRNLEVHREEVYALIQRQIQGREGSPAKDSELLGLWDSSQPSPTDEVPKTSG